MTTNHKTMAEIRDEQAHSRAVQIDKKYKPEEFTVYANARRSFIKGWDARDKLDNEALKIAVEALEDLIERHNYRGEDEWHVKALAEIRKLRGEE